MNKNDRWCFQKETKYYLCWQIDATTYNFYVWCWWRKKKHDLDSCTTLILLLHNNENEMDSSCEKPRSFFLFPPSSFEQNVLNYWQFILHVLCSGKFWVKWSHPGTVLDSTFFVFVLETSDKLIALIWSMV